MQDLERLTQLVESHLDSSVKITRSKQEIHGDYVVFCFQFLITGEHRFIKLVPQEDGELLAVVSPSYLNSPHENPDSDWYERELVSVERWLAHIIPTLFPVETKSEETLQIINRLPNEASYFIKPQSQPGINQEYYDYSLALRTANRYIASNFRGLATEGYTAETLITSA